VRRKVVEWAIGDEGHEGTHPLDGDALIAGERADRVEPDQRERETARHLKAAARGGIPVQASQTSGHAAVIHGAGGPRSSHGIKSGGQLADMRDRWSRRREG
jgi:hypothetical protein